MKNLVFLLLPCLFISCNYSDNSADVLKRENELLKRELELNGYTNTDLLVTDSIYDPVDNYDYTRNVRENVAYCKNSKFTIRIDYLNNGQNRYTSWDQPKKITDQPSLVLYDGRYESSSSGNRGYIFNNGKWTYYIHYIVVSEDDTHGLFLDIYSDQVRKVRFKMTDLFDYTK